jgi:hypothetical protein
VIGNNPFGQLSAGFIRIRGRWRDSSVWDHTETDHRALLPADMRDVVTRTLKVKLPTHVSLFTGPTDSLGSAWCTFDVDHEKQKRTRAATETTGAFYSWLFGNHHLLLTMEPYMAWRWRKYLRYGTHTDG